MYSAVVVTHCGPCQVTKELYEQIENRKKVDRKFESQVLFTMEFDIEGYRFIISSGSMVLVKKMRDFEVQFIMSDPAVGRIISL